MEFSLRELADAAGGELHGDPDYVVRQICAMDAAEDLASHGVGYLVAGIPVELAMASQIPVLVVSRLPAVGEEDKHWIVVEDPQLGFAKIAQLFHPLPHAEVHEIHPTAIVHPDAILEEPVRIGAHAVVGAHARIGKGAVLMEAVSVGERCRLGQGCVLYPRVVIYPGCVLGKRVQVHAGSVIGADGFGNAREGGKFVRIPQIGGVVIGEDTQIGAGTTIDRGTLAPTRIGRGVRIDNLVMIAHNCVVGDDTALAAQVGLAGSTKVGARCMLGGQVGVAGHLRIGDDIVVGAQAGVIGNLVEPGLYWGTPARKKTEVLRGQAELAKMAEVRRRLRQLERRLDASDGAADDAG